MKNLYLPILTLLLLLPSTMAMAQKQDDGPVGIFESRAEYSQFMGGAKRAAYGEGGSAELQAMIPMLNDIALNKPVGWTANEYSSTGSSLGLLSDANIRAEIEMVDDQYNELQQLNSAIQKRAAAQIQGLDFSDRDNLIQQIRSIRDAAASDLNAVLLPHQIDRLRQIRMQSQLRRRSLVEVLTSDPLKSDLKITDRQSNELREEEQKIQADLAKEIAKLRQRAQDRLLSRLKPNQKAEVESMIGDAFEFSQKSKDKNRGQKPGAQKRKK